MIILPQTGRGADTLMRDEAAVVDTLHRQIDPKGEIGCLNPVLNKSYLDAAYRKAVINELRGNNPRKPTPVEVRQSIISDGSGSWSTVDEKGADLTASIEGDLLKAYAEAIIKAPRKRQSRLLTVSDIPNIVFKSKCLAQLDRPVIYRGWAFVSRSSATAGHLYALRRDPNGWTVIGHRFTYIA